MRSTGGGGSITNLWIHFLHRHLQDTIVIMEEVNCTHHRFPNCDMFAPQTALKYHCPTTTLCARGEERKLRRLEEIESRKGGVIVFKEYVHPLAMVSYFGYPGQTLAAIDNN